MQNLSENCKQLAKFETAIQSELHSKNPKHGTGLTPAEWLETKSFTPLPTLVVDIQMMIRLLATLKVYCLL